MLIEKGDGIHPWAVLSFQEDDPFGLPVVIFVFGNAFVGRIDQGGVIFAAIAQVELAGTERPLGDVKMVLFLLTSPQPYLAVRFEDDPRVEGILETEVVGEPGNGIGRIVQAAGRRNEEGQQKPGNMSQIWSHINSIV